MGLKVRVRGRVRLKRKVRFGPFKRETWEEEKFDIVLSLGEEARPAQGIFLRCTGDDSALEVDGTVKGTSCFFGRVDSSKLRAKFVMGSVKNIEFSGDLEAVQ